MPWTAQDIPDLERRDAVVTGANSGLGFQIARELARHRARVVLGVRDTAKGDEAARQIRDEIPGAELEIAKLDLASLASVRDFAAWYRSSRETLDLLVNNAGVMALPRRETEDGFEMQFGTNHLGHFALTGLLLPALLAETARQPARVVTMSSSAHQLGRIDFDDLQRERRYQRWLAYGQSKLANLLFAFELSKRLALNDMEDRLLSVAAHPGYAATNLQTQGARMEGSKLKAAAARLGNKIFAQSDAQGALPALYAATAPDVSGGEYFGPDGRAGQRGYPTRAGTTKKARDPELARRLWQASEELTGVKFEI